MLVVWSDSLDDIVALCSEFESKLIKLVWRHRGVPSSSSGLTSGAASIVAPSSAPSDINLTEKVPTNSEAVTDPTGPKETPKKSRWNWSWKLQKKNPAANSDVEKGTKQQRPIRLYAPFYGGFGAALSLCKSSLSVPISSILLMFYSLRRKRSFGPFTRMETRPRLHEVRTTGYEPLLVLRFFGEFTFEPLRGNLFIRTLL